MSKQTCSECGRETYDWEETVDGKIVCSSCMGGYEHCDRCGGLFPYDELEETDRGVFCDDCLCP